VIENLCKLLFFSQLYLPGVPKLALVHHFFGLSAFRQVSPPIATYVVLTEALLPLAYRSWPFVVVSPSTRDDLIRRGLPEANIRVIPNGLDHATYHPDETVPEADLVVFVGRLEHYKGIDLLLDAWSAVVAARPGARLAILGAGSAGDAMKRRVAATGLGKSVSFAGFVPEAEKITWLRRGTVVVQPSRKEGWGLTVLEANACGSPVVATDVPGLRDSVRHGETGLLSPSGDARALAANLVSVLENRELRARLARGAREWSQRFSWDAVTAAFAEQIRAAADRRPLPAAPELLSSTADGALAGASGGGERSAPAVSTGRVGMRG
jgi:glycosyltransferase involved in cell wall biosynthesis